jgi:methylase of polypeptide subunit release factors
MSITKAMGVARVVPLKRHRQDFYATPHACTVAFVRQEFEHLLNYSRIWEPAAGTGAILHILHEFGFKTVASDIVDRGVPGVVLKSFTEFDEALADCIVTNPPYGSRAPEKFVRHALRLSIPYIALFLKANYFHTIERLRLYSIWAPTAIYPLTWRPDWTGEGSPTMDMTWFVWDAKRKGQVFKPLAHPVAPEDKPADLPLFAAE